MKLPTQQTLPGLEVVQEYSCPLCDRVCTLFGQYAPHQPWFVCRECSIKYPYPIDLFVPSTRQNKSREPFMIDPNSPHERRELRIQLEEMLRCAVDPTRIERPIVKYNLSGLEIRNPIRRSKAGQYQKWHLQAKDNNARRQMSLPICDRCGGIHDRRYELLPGQPDYKSKCQRCEDEEAVESFWQFKGIFGNDDEETIFDRIYRSHPELFERGVMPDYWYTLKLKASEV